MQKLNWGIITQQKLNQTVYNVGIGKFWDVKHADFAGIDSSNGEVMA